MSTKANTPMLQQYFQTKEQYPGTLLAMRVGDFFEFYGEDAETAARELEITLTARDDRSQRVAMAGVPHHSVERYIARLVKKGYKVALCDQIEDPRYAKGLVKRRVTRVVTPGTATEDSMLDARQNNYLVAAVSGDPRFGLSVVDVSTGEFLATEVDGDLRKDRLLQEIMRLEPAEVLVPEGDEILADEISGVCSAAVTLYQEKELRPIGSREVLLRHFGTATLSGFGCEEYITGLDAAALVLRYLRASEMSNLQHITSLSTYSVSGFMHLDTVARRHLELTQSLSEGAKKHTLCAVLDQTITPLGARMLRRWLDEPLLDVSAISGRQNAVEELVADSLRRAEVRDALRQVGDLERLASRSATGTANPRDLAALLRSLLALPALRNHIEQAKSAKLTFIHSEITPLGDLAHTLATALVDDPPMQTRDGGIIRPGYSVELDLVRNRSSEGKQFIAELEKRERERTGITALKVGYNSVFGYYIEVPRSQTSKAPNDYDRRQTTAAAERYTTVALKEYQVMVTGAEERLQQIEFDLFVELRALVASYSPKLRSIARAVAELDVLATFAEVAVRNRYTRPTVSDEPMFEVKGGRHPVVEFAQSGVSFVPNDCELNDSDQRVIILTGPNMSGKSTFLRQNALIAVMAQIGCFVPADQATIGLIDRIFTRVGARDELAAGQSTFMVEMTETANILNNATSRSLVALDEIGRGTSTYDGLAIAWSVAEALARIGCKTLFATHYHHLNDLAEQMSGVRNYRVAVKEQGDRVIWLHKVLPGGTDRSYGIQVARMAGVPMEVIERAREILHGLESSGVGGEASSAPPIFKTKRLQLTLFDAEPSPILVELAELSLDELTPIEALIRLQEWKRRHIDQGKAENR